MFERLPFVQREALVLAVVQGLPYDEIAESTGVSVGTVKSRISRGRNRLRQLLIGADEGVGTLGRSPEPKIGVASGTAAQSI
jgi:RNA polymerase sigma-70 factor (ECF subfamily)